ncbi:MAG: SH3 domain-containing protein [Lachnospiraceae bacterium]|nr:SH3 domain-containing protein [Lachnospiraceae bacterium]
MEKKRKRLKKLAAVLLIAAVLFTVPAGCPVRAETETEGIVTAHELYIRTGPGTDYDNIMVGGEKAVLKENQIITVLGVKDGWYHVRAVVDGELIEGYSLSGKDDTVYIRLDNGEGPETPPVEENKEKAGDEKGSSDDGKEEEKAGKSGEEEKSEKEDKSDKEDKTGKEEKSDKEDKTEKEDKSDKKDNSGKSGFDPTDLSEGVPEGYMLGKLSWSAKYNYTGKVAAKSGLNMRRSAKTDAEVLAVLEYDQEVVVIKSTIVTTKNDKGKSVKTRWYRVIANTGGKYEAGYVVSNYITLDCGDGIEALTRYAKQVIRKKPTDGAKRLKNDSGKAILLAKKDKVSIVEDLVGTDGARYFKINVTKGENEYEGYIPAIRLSFVSNTSNYSVNILEKIEAEAETDQEKGDEPEPPVLRFDEANALIKNSAGLAVTKEPQNTAERLFTEDKKLILLYDGESVQVIDTVSDGETAWCYIKFYYDSTEYFGYVRSSYVESLNSVILDDSQSQSSATVLGFEDKLEKEGFPESYKVLLRELHNMYPSWEFRACHTGLDWEEAIAAESEVGINLIPNNYSVEWKSLATGAYSWKTDSFTVFDGSSWVTASEEAVRYYMDPRNFLTPERIFQFEILTYSPLFQDREGVANILKNTALSGTNYSYTDASGATHEISYEDTFIMAAEYTGVSPFHLASRVKQEVTVGTASLSNSVTGTVEGYEGIYNFYNIGAYHSTAAGGAIRNGLKFASSGSSNPNVLIPWSDPFRAILGGAFYIGNNYINRGQNTIYLQKFNMTANNTYAHQYMANVEAPYSEGVRVFKGYVAPEEIPVVFSIPVYRNMPEEASPKPEKQYNPNNWLKTLKICNIDGKKLALTPTFDYTIDQEYSLIVASDTDCLKIKASTVSSLAKVVSDKTIELEIGLNRIVVQSEAENGDVRDYVINVVREEPAEETAKEPENGSDAQQEQADPDTEENGLQADEPSPDGEGQTEAAEPDNTQNTGSAEETVTEDNPVGTGNPAEIEISPETVVPEENEAPTDPGQADETGSGQPAADLITDEDLAYGEPDTDNSN